MDLFFRLFPPLMACGLVLLLLRDLNRALWLKAWRNAWFSCRAKAVAAGNPRYRYDGVDEDGQHWLEKLDDDGEPTERYVPVRLHEYEELKGE